MTVEEEDEDDEMEEKPCGSVVVMVRCVDVVDVVVRDAVAAAVEDPIAEPGQSPIRRKYGL